MKMTHRPMGHVRAAECRGSSLGRACLSKKKKKVDRRGVGGKRKREREKQGEEAV